MVLLLVAGVAVFVGSRVRSWWVLAVPILVTISALGALELSGRSLGGDTPVPFLVLFTEVFLAAGVWRGARRRPGVTPA